MLKRKSTQLLVAGTIAILTLASTLQAKAADAVPVLLCPFGCGPMAGDTILMNQMIKSGSNIILLPQETPGYMYNIREMGRNKNKWKNFIFKTEDVLIQIAYAGGSKAVKEFIPEEIKIPWKLLYGEAFWGQGKFLVTYDCSLKSAADLKGKRISLGLRGQSDWGVYSRLWLEIVHGITPENTDIRHMTPGQLTQQLIDGATDASVTPIGTEPALSKFLIPRPVRQLEATGKKMCYLGVTKDDIDKLNAKIGTTFQHVNLPPNTLPHQNEPLGIGINKGFAAVHDSFAEEKAYEVVKSVIEIGPKMGELHALWRSWSTDLMTCGLSEDNTHPGAIRAYKEKGIWDLRKKCGSMTYPTN